MSTGGSAWAFVPGVPVISGDDEDHVSSKFPLASNRIDDPEHIFIGLTNGVEVAGSTPAAGVTCRVRTRQVHECQFVVLPQRFHGLLDERSL